MDDPPYPADRRAHETLLEIPPHELEQQAAPFHQISQKKRSWKSKRHVSTETLPIFSITCKRNIRLTGMCRSCYSHLSPIVIALRTRQGQFCLPGSAEKTMQQNYFILVLAHSLRGKLRRVRVPLRVVYAVMALALLGCISIFGFISSYARMAWKVANYNALRNEVEALRVRYQRLQKVSNQTNQQMASLEMFANEVSIAYGIKQKLEGPAGIAAEGRLLPTFSDSVAAYRVLRSYHRAENTRRASVAARASGSRAATARSSVPAGAAKASRNGRPRVAKRVRTLQAGSSDRK